MEFKNVFTMKQPDLGKKISELRKQKGLTQEELVEKCNINVRTIQRIEAGDVTPRSFTIKTILEVLGVDSETFFGASIHEEETANFSKEDVSALRTSWVAALFFTIFTGVGLIIEVFLATSHGSSSGEFIYRTIMGAFSLVTLFFFLKGYKILGERFKHNSLVSATYIYFILSFIMTSITIIISIFDVGEGMVEIIGGVLLILILGIGELILGLGIQKLKDQLGSFAQTLGIIKIVNGAMLITIIFSPISIFIAVPVLIMETIFLYQTAQKLSN